MPKGYQELTASELHRLFMEEVKRFTMKLESGCPWQELQEIRKNIQRIYSLMDEGEKIELLDIYGNNYLRSVIKDLE
jgi:hypothetical protein